jgi:hypothetical protein
MFPLSLNVDSPESTCLKTRTTVAINYSLCLKMLVELRYLMRGRIIESFTLNTSKHGRMLPNHEYAHDIRTCLQTKSLLPGALRRGVIGVSDPSCLEIKSSPSYVAVLQ